MFLPGKTRILLTSPVIILQQEWGILFHFSVLSNFYFGLTPWNILLVPFLYGRVFIQKHSSSLTCILNEGHIARPVGLCSMLVFMLERLSKVDAQVPPYWIISFFG